MYRSSPSASIFGEAEKSVAGEEVTNGHSFIDVDEAEMQFQSPALNSWRVETNKAYGMTPAARTAIIKQ